MKIVSENKVFGGIQRVYVHRSDCCHCDMRFGAYLPPQIALTSTLPAVFWLSGLTCTEQNFITKACAQRVAAELGVILIAPDTSPRGDGVPDESDSYDFGKGAGFYLDATQMPWENNYQMYSYIVSELRELVVNELPVDGGRLGISGHSMGGHGALTIHLKNPALFKSASAFAPIVAPSQVPWGQKAFSQYLGDNKIDWANYDAVELIKRQPSKATLLVDQGSVDEFLVTQLKPKLLQRACNDSGQHLKFNHRDGYDHSYFFIASYIEEHLNHHYRALEG